MSFQSSTKLYDLKNEYLYLTGSEYSRSRVRIVQNNRAYTCYKPRQGGWRRL